MTPLSSEAQIGEIIEMVVVESLTRTQIVQYAGASGDFHPFHTDEAHAVANGFDSVFAHGMHTMGLTGRLVSALAGDAAVERYRAELRSQVWPGDTLTATATVVAMVNRPDSTAVEVELETRNQEGSVVLTGTATVCLDM